MRRLALVLVLALAGCSGSDERGLVVGVVDDAARSEPEQLIGELVESGFDAPAVSSLWDPGVAAPTPR